MSGTRRERARRWLCAREPELDARREPLARIKDSCDLAFVASRMVLRGDDVEVWRALGARAWQRLDHGRAILDAGLWPEPALLEPFHVLGLYGGAPRSSAAPDGPSAVIMDAARASIGGGDPAALGPRAAEVVRGLPWHRLDAEAIYLVTHVVFFVWREGVPREHRPVIQRFLDAVTPRVVAARHVDLAAELLVVSRSLARRDPDELCELVHGAQQDDGMFPAFAVARPATVDAFTWGYHATLAGLLAV